MDIRRFFIVGFGAALLTTTSQNPMAQAAGGKVMVHLDVRAEDASGRLVRDLKASDFRVFENGKRQTLSNVSLVDLPVDRPAAAGESNIPAPRDIASNVNGNGHGRSYILCLSDTTLSEVQRPGITAAYAKVAREFVEKHLMPGDLAALSTWPSTSEMSRSLTANRAALLEAIDRLPSGVHGVQEAEDPFLGLKALADYLGSAPGGRKAIVMFPGGNGGDSPSRALFALPYTQESDSLLEMMRATASANVVIYAVDPYAGRLGPWAHPGAQLTYTQAHGIEIRKKQQRLTGWTGGFAVTDPIDLMTGQFERIVEDVSAYFLDYESSDQKADGKYRELRVEVTKPGVKVRTRLGYVAPKKN